RADYVCVSSKNGFAGIWGPVSQIQSLLVLGELRQTLLGKDVEEAVALLSRAARARHGSGHWTTACTACDLALWDLRAKAAGVPVWQLLAPQGRKSVPCYLSLLGYDLLAPPPIDSLRKICSGYWGTKWAARLGPADGEDGVGKTIAALARLRELELGRLMV